MRNPKQKGSSFERKVCTALSWWVSKGADRDLFWRSSISGGRATVALRKGRSIKAAGDICAVSPEGHKLTDIFFIECKHYKSLDLDAFIYGRGKLAKFWTHCVEQALAHQRSPMLIAKQNNYDTLILLLRTSRVRMQPLAEIGTAAVYRFDDYLRTACRLS